MDKGLTSSSRARLSDVAKLAGVSTATVSRVLSCPDLVAESTRQAVTEALAATGYRMNHAARNLRKQRTGSVVALVPNLGNPFFAKILDGMGKELASAGYDLLVADTLDDAGRHTTLQRFMDASRADGIILMDGMVPLDHLRGTHGRSDLPPLITACEWVEESELPRVMLDNREGARMAVQHLRALGHRHIGVIGGPDQNVLHKSRLAGVHEVSDGLRLTLFGGDFTLQAGREAAEHWMELAPDQQPSAVFAFSDEMACAFMASLQRRGIVAPRDISIVGFDDIELVSHLAPALTTIRQPKRELGRQAARTILQRISGAEVDAVTLLAPQLMLRETTAPFI